jgi:hypothetical protein
MGESFGYASADSLDMSWLPLSRFESRAVCVAVSRRERGARAPHPISVGSRRRGLSVGLWMGESFRYAGIYSLDMSWLPLPRFESRTALPDLGPVLSPLGSAAACRLAVLGLQKFPSGAPKRAPRTELEACSDRTKSKEQRRRLGHVLLIIMWPDITPAILLLQLLLN